MGGGGGGEGGGRHHVAHLYSAHCGFFARTASGIIPRFNGHMRTCMQALRLIAKLCVVQQHVGMHATVQPLKGSGCIAACAGAARLFIPMQQHNICTRTSLSCVHAGHAAHPRSHWTHTHTQKHTRAHLSSRSAASLCPLCTHGMAAMQHCVGAADGDESSLPVIFHVYPLLCWHARPASSFMHGQVCGPLSAQPCAACEDTAAAQQEEWTRQRVGESHVVVCVVPHFPCVGVPVLLAEHITAALDGGMLASTPAWRTVCTAAFYAAICTVVQKAGVTQPATEERVVVHVPPSMDGSVPPALTDDTCGSSVPALQSWRSAALKDLWGSALQAAAGPMDTCEAARYTAWWCSTRSIACPPHLHAEGQGQWGALHVAPCDWDTPWWTVPKTAEGVMTALTIAAEGAHG